MKNNYPKISIITPSYNQGKYIEDTILSVLGQAYPNLEYMVFDANSNDNTVDILKKHEEKLTYWVSEKDEGQADAINKGFLKCTGDILMWLNSDDILMPNVLHFIAEKYIELGDGIFFGNCIHFKELPSGVYATGSDVGSSYNLIPLELGDAIIQPSSFWSRNVWLKNGILNEKFHYGFDWEWFLRAKNNNITFYAINKPISLYRFHEEHKTGIGGEKRQEELLNIYNMYSPKYAKLYDLARTENFTLTFIDRIFLRFFNFIFKKNFTKSHLLKMIKKNKYKEYSAQELNAIKGML